MLLRFRCLVHIRQHQNAAEKRWLAFRHLGKAIQNFLKNYGRFPFTIRLVKTTSHANVNGGGNRRKPLEFRQHFLGADEIGFELVILRQHLRILSGVALRRVQVCVDDALHGGDARRLHPHNFLARKSRSITFQRVSKLPVLVEGIA